MFQRKLCRCPINKKKLSRTQQRKKQLKEAENAAISRIAEEGTGTSGIADPDGTE